MTSAKASGTAKLRVMYYQNIAKLLTHPIIFNKANIKNKKYLFKKWSKVFYISPNIKVILSFAPTTKLKSADQLSLVESKFVGSFC